LQVALLVTDRSLSATQVGRRSLRKWFAGLSPKEESALAHDFSRRSSVSALTRQRSHRVEVPPGKLGQIKPSFINVTPFADLAALTG
jgi:hypothetical protein